MAKKAEKVIHLITDSFEGSAIDTLQMLEPGPVFIVTGETPDGLGVYLCTQPFTLEEAEGQHNLTEEEDVESEFDVIPDDIEVAEQE